MRSTLYISSPSSKNRIFFLLLLHLLTLPLAFLNDKADAFQLGLHSQPRLFTHQRSEPRGTTSYFFTFHETKHLFPFVTKTNMASTGTDGEVKNKPHCPNVLFVECGFGNDSHGQSSTKAAVRACRNAIEFNSIPSINRLVPGGYDKLKLDVIIAVPPKYQADLDLDTVAKVFPYGETKFTIQDGGMIAPSGIEIDSLGDKNDDMVVVCASVTVGY